MLKFDLLREKKFIIAGPCAAESEELCIEVAKFCKSVCDKYGFTYIFKASFDKANRTSIDSYRGPGIQKGIEIFKKVKNINPYICTDIHNQYQPKQLENLVDILQIPAFLARQTDIVVATAKTDCIINIKKPQFISSAKVKHIVEKCKQSGNPRVLLTERGSMFGSDDLVVDFRNILELKKNQLPVIIDCTHSCQKMTPGAKTGGNREYAPYFAKAGVLFGSQGVFAEVHPTPSKGLSDSANMIDFGSFEDLIKDLRKMIDANLC